jgi:hypothetical protein
MYARPRVKVPSLSRKTRPGWSTLVVYFLFEEIGRDGEI